ncbi:MAG: hypothetical protein HC922_06720, partial [Leptolyngbyaceae cyanobacterium SM2_3_12]|nr:hypothetical protein [Leptolyngbyaceae cyanobacterium SM2_3_12]
PASRQELARICQRLQSLGEQLDLTHWCVLAQAAGQAVANPQQTYRTLAPIIIRDLKHCQELVLAGNANQVLPSPALLDLVPGDPQWSDDEVLDPTMELDTLLAEPWDEDGGESDFLDLFGETDDATGDLPNLDETDEWFDQLTQPVSEASDQDSLAAVFNPEESQEPVVTPPPDLRSRSGAEIDPQN